MLSRGFISGSVFKLLSQAGRLEMSCGHVREGCALGHRVTLIRLVRWASPRVPWEGALGEELVADPARVLGRAHGVAHGPRVCEDLMVVPTLQRHDDMSRGADAA